MLGMLYSFRKQKQYYFSLLFRFLLLCATDFRIRGHLITITKGTFSYSGRSPVLRRASCPVSVLVPAFAIYDRNLFVFKRAINLKLANFRNLTKDIQLLLSTTEIYQKAGKKISPRNLLASKKISSRTLSIDFSQISADLSTQR